MAAELTDQKNLSTVIDYLRDTNATEELMLDEVVSHKDVLASNESKKFIHEVPILLEFIGEVLGDMMLMSKDIVKNGLQLIQNQREDAEEARLDDKEGKKNKADKASSGVTFKGIGDLAREISKSSFIEKLIKIPVLLGGILTGFVEGIIAEFPTITKILSIAKNKITSSFTKLFSEEGAIGSFVSKFTKVFSSEGLIGSKISILVSPLSKLTSIGAVSEFFEGVSKFFKGLTRIFKFARGIGVLAAKFFKIYAIWESIVGAIEGYKVEGVLGAIKGGISGLLNSLVGSLLDLAKSGISWLLGALGWDEAEQFLDSFSFSKLISDGVKAIVDGLAYYVDYLKGEFSLTKFEDAFKQFGIAGILMILAGGIMDMLKSAASWVYTIFGDYDMANALDNFSFQDLYKKIFASVGDAVNGIIDKIVDWFKSIPDTIGAFTEKLGDIREQLIKSVLQNVLPRKDRNGAWYSPNNLAAAAIPASVYEYAGMNPETGEVIKKVEPAVSTNVKDTAAAISTNPAAGGAPTIINNVSRGGDVNNVSNSNVNQNVNGAAGPIYTGSAMGLYSY